jgi:hypothetical protein
MRIYVVLDDEQGEKGMLIPMLLEEVIPEDFSVMLAPMGWEDDDPMMLTIEAPEQYKTECENALKLVFGEPVFKTDLDTGSGVWDLS